MVRTSPEQSDRVVKRLRDAHALSSLIGEAPAFAAVLARLPALARGDATILISGETGTGKELVARAIHYLGNSAPFPFIPINCGSLPESLFEDELFGHARGAFTDAREQRAGLIAQAERGTLFLDEVECLPLRAQAALLRLLQDKSYRALGSTREVRANVRFLAATNRPLRSLVAAGEFRGDLYYRLCVLSVELPALR
ncbi:MAG TPA: sigma-54 factor interaction domain-containing protein, partial [Gemmatimonadaceae bacterium]